MGEGDLQLLVATESLDSPRKGALHLEPTRICFDPYYTDSYTGLSFVPNPIRLVHAISTNSGSFVSEALKLDYYLGSPLNWDH